VIGILIDDDLVGVPEPAIAKGDVVWGDAKEEAAKPKTRRAASCKVPDMVGAESPSEVSVLPRMIKMVVSIVPAGVMPHPLITIDVRGVRVAWLIGVIAVFLGGASLAANGSGAMSRRGMNLAACPVFFSFLRKRHKGNYKHGYENCESFFHNHLQSLSW
jgi:hypothetical protein